LRRAAAFGKRCSLSVMYLGDLTPVSVCIIITSLYVLNVKM